MELTRALRASILARKTPLLPGLTAGKTACHSPAAATAGFFKSGLEQLPYQLHLYRRITLPECFADKHENSKFRTPALMRIVTFCLQKRAYLAGCSKFLLNACVSCVTFPPHRGRNLLIRSLALNRASIPVFIYTLGHFLDTKGCGF